MKRILIACIFLASGIADASQFSGSWAGKYLVKKGSSNDVSAVTLKITETVPSKIQAVFYFHEIPVSENIEGRNQTAGCFAMSGVINQKTQKISLNSTGWLGGKSLTGSGINFYTGKKFEWSESITASVQGNELTGTGIRNTADKSQTSFSLKKIEDGGALLPSRCEIVGAQQTITQPSPATIGFMNAMGSANYDVMAIYLQKGADINCKNCSDSSKDLESQTSPLMIATRGSGYGIIRMVKWLIDHGADVNQADAYGRTPVMNAAHWTQIAIDAEIFGGKGASQGDDQLLQLLLSSGGKTGVRDLSLSNAVGQLFPSGFNAESASQPSGFSKTVRLLSANGEDINLRNQFGDTALIRAARNCAIAVIPNLLNLGAAPGVLNALGQSALDIALEKAQTNSPQCNASLKTLSNPNLTK